MKIYAFLLVLLSAFCAAFARYDITNSERRSALMRTVSGSLAAATRGLKSDGAVTTTPLDDDTDNETDNEMDDMEDDSEDDISEPDTEADFNSDVESIDGDSDDDCPTGQYIVKYMPKQRFSFGNKYKRVKVKNLRACGKVCANKKSRCGTFNFNKFSKQCQMFTSKSIGRGKVKDNAGVAAYLACAN